MSINDVQLAWCLLGDVPRSTRFFEECRGKGDRPEGMICPNCKEPVILALSPERKIADHFKHKPESSCEIRQGGESAAHLNAKTFLAALFSKARRVDIEMRCRNCRRLEIAVLIEDYTVEVEYRIHTRKPDIAILRDGTVALAVEIFHTHKVDRVKAEDFSANKTKWIELKAEDAMQVRRTDDENIANIESEWINDSYLKTFLCYECKQKGKQLEAMARVAMLIRKIQPDNPIETRYGAQFEPKFIWDSRPCTMERALQLLDQALDHSPWWWNWEWDEIKFAHEFLRKQ